jgi:hypothetical protein
MRFYFAFLWFFSIAVLSAQQTDSAITFFRGTIIDSSTGQPMIGANIINLNQLKGDSTDENGMFSLLAKTNDSIMISFLGFKTVNILVNKKNIDRHQTIYLLKAPLSLDEVIISSNQLTGRLPIDIYLIPIQEPIDIAPSIAAMFGSRKETRLSKLNDVPKKLMNPVDLIYNIFSTRAKDMRRLKQIQKEEKVREILASKFDREILSRLLKIDKKDVYLVLEMCDYSEEFITKANDLQILEAILNCYSKYDMYIDKK